jgi:hypothetical protein
VSGCFNPAGKMTGKRRFHQFRTTLLLYPSQTARIEPFHRHWTSAGELFCFSSLTIKRVATGFQTAKFDIIPSELMTNNLFGDATKEIGIAAKFLYRT